MDQLNLQPEQAAKQTDTTFNVEGYDAHVEEIENAYPEQDFRTPAEKAVQDQANQQAQPQQPQGEQPVQPQEQVAEVANQVATQVGEQLGIQPQQPQEQPEPEPEPKQPTRFTWQYDENGDIPVEQIQAAYGGKVPEGVIRKLALTKDYLGDKEDVLRDLFDDSQNLEKQLQAFMMIRNDPELTVRYDHNEDGEITYDDFFDTTNDPDWSEEKDAHLTQEWIEGLQSKDAGSRLRALWQGAGAGQNMARYINLRREHALSDVGEGSESWAGNRNVGEGIRQNTAGGLFDITATGLEVAGRFENAANGKSFWEDSDLDERVLQHTNENSLEYLVNHNLRRSAMDTLTYEVGYWAVPTMLTGGIAGAVGGKVAAVGAAKNIPALVKAGNFLKPSLTGGTKVLSSKLGTKQIITQTVKPAQGWFGRQKAVQAINMVKSSGKSIMIADMPIAAFTDLEESGRGMMYEDGILKNIIQDDPNGHFYISALAKGSNSPMFKRADFMLTEGVLGTMGTVAIGGLGKTIARRSGQVLGALPQVPGKVTKFSQEALDTTVATTRNYSQRVETALHGQEAMFRQTQQQLKDWAEAGAEAAKRSSEGFRNAFAKGIETDGVMKSAYNAYMNGAFMMGQGYSKARSGIRQVLNDWDEIRHTIGVSNPGSTDALFNQVQMAKAAKSGIDEKQLDLFTKDLIDDVEYKGQVTARDPKGTRGVASDTSLDGIKEAVLGRDAGNTSPREFWGDLLDEPLDVADFNKLDDFKKWSIKNIEVQDAVNRSLLLQLRDQAGAASDMIGKTDIFSMTGPMERIGDNLIAGMHQLKKTQITWELARKMLREGDGKMTQEGLIELNAQVAEASSKLHSQTKDNVNTMVRMLQEQGDDELAGAVLDVFKVTDDIHGWKDFDAWMHQQIVGGKFKGEVKTGDLVKGLQKTMIQSILSGPKTPMRAMMGTTLNSYLNTINEAFGATLRRPFTGDVMAQKVAMAKLKGQFELVPEAFQIFRKEWNANFKADIADIKTRYTEASPTDDLWEAKRIHTELRGTPGEKAAFYINNQTRWLTNHKLFSWSPRALAATDDTHRWLMARSRSKELAMRQVLEETGDDWTKVTPEMLSKAEDLHLKKMTDGEGNLDFSDDAWLDKQFKEVTLTSELEGTAKELDRVFSNIPMIKPFYLFARTGINGLNFTFKNTPLIGALHKESQAILKHTGDDFTELAQYGIKNANDLKSARNLFAGRQAVGTGVVGAMGGMYMAGQLTGNGPADRKLRQTWINAGWKPNHFYIGDVGFDYTTLEPYNIIFSSIADIGDNMELMGEEWAEQRLQAAAFVIGRGLTGKTYMSGLDQMMQIAQMKPGALDKAGANILNNSIPLAGMRNEFGKWVNPHMKELNSDMWSTIRNRNQASEFLAGESSLPEKSDMLNGQPINNWNIVGRSFNAVSPVSLDIRRDTPGRRLLLDSNYDLKSTVYSYGGYSFTKDNQVRAHFQNAIGTVPVTVGFKKFNNVEQALDHLATRDDIKNSMEKMKSDARNPGARDMDPNKYPHNTIIDNLMNQARARAWAKIQQPDHPAYRWVEKLKKKKDGLDTRTRDNRQGILDLNYPTQKVEQFPQN